jgi:hypothetical protein
MALVYLMSLASYINTVAIFASLFPRESSSDQALD